MCCAKVDYLRLPLRGVRSAEIALIICEERLDMLGDLAVEMAAVMRQEGRAEVFEFCTAFEAGVTQTLDPLHSLTR